MYIELFDDHSTYISINVISIVSPRSQFAYPLSQRLINGQQKIPIKKS